MDILYIGKVVLDKMNVVCDSDLLFEVLNDFANHFDIIYCNDTNKHPTRYWSVTDYISKETRISTLNKLQVIFAFISCGGTVELFDVKYHDIGNPSIILKKEKIITDYEVSKLNDPWFEYHQNGILVHLTKIE